MNNIKEGIKQRQRWLFYHTYIKPSQYIIQQNRHRRKQTQEKLSQITENCSHRHTNPFLKTKRIPSDKGCALSRVSSSEDQALYLNKCKAIERIRPVFQNHILRSRLRKLIAQMKFEKRNKAALKVQNHFRQHLMMQRVKVLSLVHRVSQSRNEAAAILQRAFRRVLIGRRTRLLRLSVLIVTSRTASCLLIQKTIKRYLTQQKYLQIVKLERTLPKVSWQGKGQQVVLIGDFNAWKEKIPMIRCPLRHIFVRYLQGISRGDYEFKFIVDGSYQLSSYYEIIESFYCQGPVNVLTVRSSQSNKASSNQLTATLSYTTLESEDNEQILPIKMPSSLLSQVRYQIIQQTASDAEDIEISMYKESD